MIGWFGDALKVRVRAPAERGKANTAVENLLAKVLGIPNRKIKIIAGQKTSNKAIEVDGITELEARRRIESFLKPKSV